MEKIVVEDLVFKKVGDEVYIYSLYDEKLIFVFDLKGENFKKRCNDFIDNLGL